MRMEFYPAHTIHLPTEPQSLTGASSDRPRSRAIGQESPLALLGDTCLAELWRELGSCPWSWWPLMEASFLARLKINFNI